MADTYVTTFEVEAVQWTGDNLEEMQAFCGKRDVDPGTGFQVEIFNPIGTFISPKDDATAELYIAPHQLVVPIATGVWVTKSPAGYFPFAEERFTAEYTKKMF